MQSSADFIDSHHFNQFGHRTLESVSFGLTEMHFADFAFRAALGSGGTADGS